MKRMQLIVQVSVLIIVILGSIFVWNALWNTKKPSANNRPVVTKSASQISYERINVDTAKLLDIIFERTEWWGDPEVYIATSNEYASGTRYLIKLHKDALGYEPIVYIESNDFNAHASGGAWGLSANQVDLNKTDEELIKQLSFPWTTSMRIERIALSGSNGLLIEETGTDPNDQQAYRRSYYLFPKYNKEQSWNLTMTIVNPSDIWQITNFLRTITIVRSNENKKEIPIGPIRYNCELSGGEFTEDRCICPIEGMQTQKEMYDTSTGFCQSSHGGPVGDAFNASIGLPYGDYSYWTQIVLGACEKSGGSISGVACICPTDKTYSKVSGECE